MEREAPAGGSERSREQRVEGAVRIPVSAATLDGDLDLPRSAAGIVLFAHGSGSSRHSARESKRL